MLDPTNHAANVARPAAHPRSQAVFRMITSDRMAGSIPAWVAADSAKDKTIATLAQNEGGQSPKFENDLSAATLSYAPQQTEAAQNSADEPFGFDDLLDIVNPLQHIPVVSTLYRAVTGDTIRPSSEIVGGAIFGGIAGAAGSLANVIVKEETGKNFGEHALALVTGENDSPVAVASAGSATETSQTPVAIASIAPTINRDKPLERLAAAQSQPATPISQLPGNMLSFVDLGTHESANRPVRPIPAQPVRYAEIYRFNA